MPEPGALVPLEVCPSLLLYAVVGDAFCFKVDFVCPLFGYNSPGYYLSLLPVVTGPVHLDHEPVDEVYLVLPGCFLTGVPQSPIAFLNYDVEF